MKILLTTSVFWPTIGGVQSIVLLVAKEFVRMGHDVAVATSQASTASAMFPFKVYRSPSPLLLFRLYRKVDGIVQFGGVRLGWPTLVWRFRSALVHQIWPHAETPCGFIGECLRDRWLARSVNICNSDALGKAFSVPYHVIPNPYDAETFRIVPDIERNRDVVFVGRLIPEKGVDILLKAIKELSRCRHFLTVTIVGDGPMRSELENQTHGLGLSGCVVFTGSKQSHELATILNSHRVMVVPSRWQEPFGIVALEGIACGCIVVGSSGGGLPEAIGDCGVTFPNGDALRLAAALRDVLQDDQAQQRFSLGAKAHMARHSPRVIAESYLRELCR